MYFIVRVNEPIASGETTISGILATIVEPRQAQLVAIVALISSDTEQRFVSNICILQIAQGEKICGCETNVIHWKTFTAPRLHGSLVWL